ncbi:hypothetical protein FA95DRAFT_1564364 [Auriscalpium vulgare]|uniref:Uncharacterized protein n=1 Tax=Auriscalpium vulgare TaxID=40419 RepID=A0ACB8RFK3_9AGAM|nr:hypothetical protein FA95DRAFT_1564364 [Auriscalpium vulgare]
MPLSLLKIERMGRPPSSTPEQRRASPTTADPSFKVIAIRKNRTPAATALPSRSSLDWSIALAELAGDISNMLQSTPAAAAAALLTTVLKTIAAVKVNQERCVRIAKRATQALSRLGVQMAGKWDSAPQSLLDNLHELENTLRGMQDSMYRISQANWRQRFFSRPQIEDILQQCEAGLQEALQAFQFNSLIQIHYAVGGQQAVLLSDRSAIIVGSASSEPAPSTTSTESELEDFFATLREPEDDFGFRRYHQSDVVLSKVCALQSGWFSELSDADLNGRKVVVKGYTGGREDALKHWYQDIKRLRTIYHPCFPQLLGYSNGKTPRPFIVLSYAPKQDVISYLKRWWTPQVSVLEGARTILKAYRDIVGAVLYAQQQLSMNKESLQEFILNATYTIDQDNNLLLGLPVQIEDYFQLNLVQGRSLQDTMIYQYMTFLEQALLNQPVSDIRKHVKGSIVFLQRNLDLRSRDILMPEELDRMLDHSETLCTPQRLPEMSLFYHKIHLFAGNRPFFVPPVVHYEWWHCRFPPHNHLRCLGNVAGRDWQRLCGWHFSVNYESTMWMIRGKREIDFRGWFPAYTVNDWRCFTAAYMPLADEFSGQLHARRGRSYWWDESARAMLKRESEE